MEWFIKKFKALAIYLEVLTIIVLQCDRPMRGCVDDGVRPFPFAAKFSCTEKFDPGIKH